MMQSVQVIIERLKSHPEEFFGEVDDNLTLKTVYPKFHRYVKPLDELTRRVRTNQQTCKLLTLKLLTRREA